MFEDSFKNNYNSSLLFEFIQLFKQKFKQN